MSDQVIRSLLESDELLLVGTNVQGSPNIHTVVVKNAMSFSSYDFEDQDRDFVGPAYLKQSKLSSDDIERGVNQAEVVLCLNFPTAVSISIVREVINDVSYSVIDQMEFVAGDGRLALTRSGAAYPYTMVLVR